MRAHGVPIPDTYPTFYPVPTSLLTQELTIDVKTHESSGEVEPVLIVRDDAWYVTLGSDHTARDEEKFDIARSKAACPKISCNSRASACRICAALRIRARGSDSRKQARARVQCYH